MEAEIIDRWNMGKNNLRKWFENTPQKKYPDYKRIIKALVKNCFNYPDKHFSERFEMFYDTGMRECNGEILCFLYKAHVVTHEVENLYCFDLSYGSCDCNDTLWRINHEGCDEGLPTKEQVDQYMMLCLHMVQRIRCTSRLYEDPIICDDGRILYKGISIEDDEKHYVRKGRWYEGYLDSWVSNGVRRCKVGGVCVDPNTVVPFTGITDHDKNKIFLKDIVMFLGDKYEVVYARNLCSYYLRRLSKGRELCPIPVGESYHWNDLFLVGNMNDPK